MIINIKKTKSNNTHPKGGGWAKWQYFQGIDYRQQPAKMGKPGRVKCKRSTDFSVSCRSISFSLLTSVTGVNSKNNL